jgi:LAO/AO transport system kinase
MTGKKSDGSALNVNPGIPQPEQVNPKAGSLLRSLRIRKTDPDYYFEGIRNGNRTLLSQAITRIESNRPDHQEIAQRIIERCLPFTGSCIRVGITGVPGVGKSTFIERFGTYLTTIGLKIAVLAIDPSSERSRGSILGDKTRMESLSVNPAAFIRPSPSGGSLGGVARKTREAMYLCEAAGFDVILIETVGVGQSETAVHSMVDFFLLLMLAGAGDELQGIKRGIMEMADLIAINKADGENLQKAQIAKAEYENALHLMPQPPSGWNPEVLTCSALDGRGIKEIWNKINDYKRFTRDTSYWEARRADQSRYWMHQTILEELRHDFYGNKSLQSIIQKTENEVLEKRMSSFTAAQKLLEHYRKCRKDSTTK